MSKLSLIYRRNNRIAIIIIAILLIGYLFLEIKNNRFTTPDFQVYYKAAIDLMAGDNL
jgi:YbbR domain-containing protein